MRTSARASAPSLVVLLAPLAVTLPTKAQWVDLVDETAARMPAYSNDPALSTNDLEEKDYAWGDVDNDGDIDLVVVRKQPFTTTGRRVNVLFMNEGTAEGHAFRRDELDQMLDLAEKGIRELMACQREALGG